MDEPLISIILRTFKNTRTLRETLSALKSQEYRNWELIVIDSGSTGSAVDLIRSAAPRHFLQIEPQEYNLSRAMNRAMHLAQSNFTVFLNADATPLNPHWLRPLVRYLFNPQVAAVYSRQVPRPDCRAVFAREHEHRFNPSSAPVSRPDSFGMASCGFRKNVWALRGFNEAMLRFEDREYVRWCRVGGYRVAYVPESCVMYSRNYTPQEVAERSFGEGRALAASGQGSARDLNFPRNVLFGWADDAARDLGYCVRKKRLTELPHALRIRWRQRQARLDGFRSGWRTYRKPPRNANGQTPALKRFFGDSASS